MAWTPATCARDRWATSCAWTAGVRLRRRRRRTACRTTGRRPTPCGRREGLFGLAAQLPAQVFQQLVAMSQLAVLCSGAVLALGFRKLLDLRQPKAVKSEVVETKLGQPKMCHKLLCIHTHIYIYIQAHLGSSKR